MVQLQILVTLSLVDPNLTGDLAGFSTGLRLAIVDRPLYFTTTKTPPEYSVSCDMCALVLTVSIRLTAPLSCNPSAPQYCRMQARRPVHGLCHLCPLCLSRYYVIQHYDSLVAGGCSALAARKASEVQVGAYAIRRYV